MPQPGFLPSVLFYEDIAPVTATAIQPLNACIVGPNAQLVRYSQPTEKPNGALGSYVNYQSTTYNWPNLAAGGLVDLTYVELYCDTANQVFFSKLQGDTPYVTIPSGTTNQITIAGTLGFQAGTSGRLTGLYNRDVQLGDRVRVSGTVSGSTYTADSYVTGFSGSYNSATIGSATTDANNAGTQSASITSTQIAGTSNCNTINGTGLSGYNGLIDDSIDQ